MFFLSPRFSPVYMYIMEEYFLKLKFGLFQHYNYYTALNHSTQCSIKKVNYFGPNSKTPNKPFFLDMHTDVHLLLSIYYMHFSKPIKAKRTVVCQMISQSFQNSWTLPTTH